MVEAGESEYRAVLKTRNLLIFRDAQNVENGKIAPNWNVSGTRDFQPACHISFSGNYVILLSDLAYCLPTSRDGQSGINLIASCLLAMRTEFARLWAHGCQNDVFIEVSYDGRRQGPANVDGALRDPTI